MPKANPKTLCLMICAVLVCALPAHAQFTGHTLSCDRRYPTDTQVPSKYGQQVIAAKGSYFLAGPSGIKVTGTQITIALSSLYNKYTYKNTTYNGYRLTVVDGNVKSGSLRDDVLAHWRAKSDGVCEKVESLKAKSGSFARTSQDDGVGAYPAIVRGGYSGTIMSVTVDAATNVAGFDASRITFQGTYVQVNLAGLTFGVKDRIVLDVGFGGAASSAPTLRAPRPAPILPPLAQ